MNMNDFVGKKDTKRDAQERRRKKMYPTLRSEDVALWVLCRDVLRFYPSPFPQHLFILFSPSSTLTTTPERRC